MRRNLVTFNSEVNVDRDGDVEGVVSVGGGVFVVGLGKGGHMGIFLHF